jgi:hypothetical protein
MEQSTKSVMAILGLSIHMNMAIAIFGAECVKKPILVCSTVSTTECVLIKRWAQ